MTLQVSQILCDIYLSPLLLLEYTGIHLPLPLPFGGLENQHLCKIFHGTPILQGFHH